MKWIDEFINYLEIEKRYSNHTIRSYQLDIKQFQEFFFDDDIDWIKPNKRDFRSWVLFLHEQNYVPKTIHRKVSSLKSYYKFLQRTNKVEVNPLETIILPKLNKQLPTFVKEKELLNRFTALSTVDNALNDFTLLRNFLAIHLLYVLGLRISELIDLKEGNVSRSTVKIVGKGSKERIVPLLDETKKLLDRYLRLKHSCYNKTEELIVSDKGHKLYYSFFYKLVKQYLGDLSSKKQVSPHVLRHSFATHLLNNGADINVVKELLGHASLATTQGYTHTSIERLKTIYKQAHPSSDEL